jgi:acyl-coenzyme A synthetase/AMP-(fatty) acid ligase
VQHGQLVLAACVGSEPAGAGGVEAAVHARRADHPAVPAAAVIGVPHEVHGEDVVAFVVPAAGATASAEEIIACCRQNLAGFKVPREVVCSESLPLSASGKIRRFALRERAASNRSWHLCTAIVQGAVSVGRR